MRLDMQIRGAVLHRPAQQLVHQLDHRRITRLIQEVALAAGKGSLFQVKVEIRARLFRLSPGRTVLIDARQRRLKPDPAQLLHRLQQGARPQLPLRLAQACLGGAGPGQQPEAARTRLQKHLLIAGKGKGQPRRRPRCRRSRLSPVLWPVLWPGLSSAR